MFTITLDLNPPTENNDLPPSLPILPHLTRLPSPVPVPPPALHCPRLGLQHRQREAEAAPDRHEDHGHDAVRLLGLLGLL